MTRSDAFVIGISGGSVLAFVYLLAQIVSGS